MAWSGSDATSGIASYDVQARVGLAGAWTVALRITETVHGQAAAKLKGLTPGDFACVSRRLRFAPLKLNGEQAFVQVPIKLRLASSLIPAMVKNAPSAALTCR